ncbi:hypothetical protein IAR50_001718 [Cryptococcus sp. DSM 104548]
MPPIQASNLFFTPLPPTHIVPPGKESHGRYMLTIPWNRVSGWGQPKIGPRADLSFDPLAGVLQYAVTCFEGMKCYKSQEGKLRLFRPTMNFNRLKSSGARLGLPTDWDNDELLVLFQRLLALEAPIVPDTDGSSLYIRPTLLETSEGFGIKEDGYATEALLYVVTTLNLGLGLYGSAEAEGKGLRLHADKNFVRAWPGGTGNYKVGANYGTVNIAKQPGYAMSLWLHGEQNFISEAGAMNVFLLKEGKDGFLEFVTTPLSSGIVLPGITRSSLIELLTDHSTGKADFPAEGVPKNIRIVERDISMAEIVDGLKDGSVKGMFGCGTGVVVVSVQNIFYSDQSLDIPYHPIVKTLRDTMTGLQRGRVADGGRGWGVEVPEWEGVAAAKEEEGREEVIAA